MPVLEGETTLADNDVVIDWTGRNLDASSNYVDTLPDLDVTMNTQHRVLIGRDGWKLILSPLDQGELYDLNNDPYEQINLFDDLAHRERIRNMAARIKEWQGRNGDTAELRAV